jgi:hypothetical protein
MRRVPFAFCSALLFAPAATALAADAPTSPAPETSPASDPAAAGPRSTLALQGDLGIASRLGGVDSGFDASARQGLVLAASALWSPVRTFDVGLGYQRTGLGTEELAPSAQYATARIARTMQSAWLELRAYPVRGERGGLFLGLMLGPSWETSSASVYVPPASTASSGRSFRCSGAGTPSVALGASLGGELDLGSGIALITRVVGASYRGSGDFVDDCFPAIGSAVTVDGRVGLAYRFDLGPALDAR